MITISRYVEQWVDQNPFIRDHLGKGFINHSALARHIRPQIEQESRELVSVEAITIALNRLGKSLGDKPTSHDPLSYIGDVSVQTGLSNVILRTDVANIHTLQVQKSEEFFVISQGVWHTVIIAKTPMLEALQLRQKDIIMRFDNLTGLTVKLRPGSTDVPGVYSLVMQAWANKSISLREVVSTYSEITAIMSQSEAQAALKTIIDLTTYKAR